MNTPSEPATCNLLPPTDVPRRVKGKIASLPKDQRDTINKLLLDGATYAVLIERMAKLGISLNPQNVSAWYQSGFQDCLAHLERLDHQRAKYEAATDLLQNIDVSKIPEAGLQTAAAQIYDLLDRFTLTNIAAALANDPDKYIRLVHSLSRLAREALAIQKYTDARARAALRKLDANRDLDESENRAIVRHVDKMFGLDHPEEALRLLQQTSRLGVMEQLPPTQQPAQSEAVRDPEPPLPPPDSAKHSDPARNREPQTQSGEPVNTEGNLGDDRWQMQTIPDPVLSLIL